MGFDSAVTSVEAVVVEDPDLEVVVVEDLDWPVVVVLLPGLAAPPGVEVVVVGRA